MAALFAPQTRIYKLLELFPRADGVGIRRLGCAHRVGVEDIRHQLAQRLVDRERLIDACVLRVLPEIAEKLYTELRRRYALQFDVKQTIGKRYARMDEAGTPYCFISGAISLSTVAFSWTCFSSGPGCCGRSAACTADSEAQLASAPMMMWRKFIQVLCGVVKNA